MVEDPGGIRTAVDKVAQTNDRRRPGALGGVGGDSVLERDQQLKTAMDVPSRIDGPDAGQTKQTAKERLDHGAGPEALRRPGWRREGSADRRIMGEPAARARPFSYTARARQAIEGTKCPSSIPVRPVRSLARRVILADREEA